MSSLSIPAERLAGPSESLTKGEAIIKVQSLGVFAERTLAPKLKEVTDSANAIVSDHERAEKSIIYAKDDRYLAENKVWTAGQTKSQADEVETMIKAIRNIAAEMSTLKLQ